MKCTLFCAVAALLLHIAAAQNVNIDLQYPPHSVAGCRVFDLFSIGKYFLQRFIRIPEFSSDAPGQLG